MYLALVNIRKKAYSKTVKYVEDIFFRLKQKQCNNVKLILSFLGEVEREGKLSISKHDI